VVEPNVEAWLSALEPGHLNVTRETVTRDRYWPGDPPGPGRSGM